MTLPVPDPIARAYILLGLRIDRHRAGIVDGYFGPTDLSEHVASEPPRAPDLLAQDARGLRDQVARELGGQRARWLDRQLLALETLARGAAGETLPYADEVARCFDARPEPLAADEYRATRGGLESAVPGTGDLRERLDAWDARWVIPPDALPDLVAWLVGVLRERSGRHFPHPEGETLEVALVTGQPWSAYNWYDGGLRSRIEINTDLPIRVGDLIATISHETFPGHHLEHAWKEARLLREDGLLEAAILLINTPEAYISEGLAELGRRFVLDSPAWREVFREAAGRARLGCDPGDAERHETVTEARRRIRGAGGDAALRLHAEGRPAHEVQRFLEDQALMTPERAAKTIEFVSHPLWRTYVFSYAGGERLLSRWCDAAGDPEAARHRFFRLLSEQLTPSGIADEVEAA